MIHLKISKVIYVVRPRVSAPKFSKYSDDCITHSLSLYMHVQQKGDGVIKIIKTLARTFCCHFLVRQIDPSRCFEPIHVALSHSLSLFLLLSGVLNNMDRNANPCTDFYQYSCGGWEKKNYLDDSQPFLFAYLNVANENKRKLKEVLENTEIKSNHFAVSMGAAWKYRACSMLLSDADLDSPVRTDLL